MESINNLSMFKSFMAVIYPNKCMICRRLLTSLEDEYICTLCHQRLHNQVYSNNKQKEIFFEQLQEDDVLENRPMKIISLFPYEGEYRRAILRWKYKGVRKYAKGFARLLVEEKHFELLQDAVLVPIPLALSRMKTRGFNQALDLAVEISRLTGITVLDGLKRICDTKPQASCSKQERLRNVKGSMDFVNSSSKKVKAVILVDDIYTTGSTIKEAIRALSKSEIFRDALIYTVAIGIGAF